MARKTACRTGFWRTTVYLLACLGAALTQVTGCERQETDEPAAEETGAPVAKQTAQPAAKETPSLVAGPEAAITIYTTFYPTTYFAERIGGDRVEVVCPCPADADPALWMPDDATIAAYQQADLIVVNGASFEKWLGKVTLPEARLVDTTKPLADDLIVLEGAMTHSHGPQGEHTHEGIDGHTWLDPINAKTQAGEIKAALVKGYPGSAAAFEQGYAALAEDLDALDARLKGVSAKMKTQVVLCSHPAYNYIGRRYGWQLKTYHLDPGQMPGDETFYEIKSFLEEQPAKYILWEAQPTEEIAERMRAELGLESLLFSPCEMLTAEELERGKDLLSVMNQNADTLEQVFGT
jgi:zinc transport system substrate-binding protein